VETSEGSLCVLGCLTLAWPFTAEAATCPNARILERVVALLAATRAGPDAMEPREAPRAAP
jgi:hypothetical protein